MCLEEYFVIYTLKLAIYFKNYENIIVSREKNHLTLEMLESLENLAGAEFLPVRAFLGFFLQNIYPCVVVIWLLVNQKDWHYPPLDLFSNDTKHLNYKKNIASTLVTFC